ncbi:hypothetical protein D3C83_252430 [compost metagenome]
MVQGKGKVLTADLAVPRGRLDQFESAVDADLLELVDKDDRGITVACEIPRGHLQL